MAEVFASETSALFDVVFAPRNKVSIKLGISAAADVAEASPLLRFFFLVELSWPFPALRRVG